MSIQIARDGRRILWLAHESAPKNFTGVDVSDPRKPKIVVQTDPAGKPTCAPTRSRPSATSWSVAYQVQKHGQKPAGFELFDISVPETPKSIAFVDASGPGSRGVHQLWFCDGETVHMAAGAPDFAASNLLDDQFYRAFDVREPVRARGGEPLVDAGHARGRRSRRRPCATSRRATTWASAPTTPTSIPQRPDRCYLGYIDGGMFILDISDRANPKPLCRWDNSPPFSGFTHTVLPLFERELLVVTDESVVDDATGLAEADLDPRRPRGDQSGADRHLPGRQTWRTTPSAAAASAPTTSTRTCRGRPPGTPTASSWAPSSTAACAPTTSPIRIGPRRSPRSCHRRRAAHPPAPSSSTTCSSTSGRSSTPSTASIGGLYILEMGF